MFRFDGLSGMLPSRRCVCVRKIVRRNLITAGLWYQSEQIFVADNYPVTLPFTGFDTQMKVDRRFRLKRQILLIQNERLQRNDSSSKKTEALDVYR